MAWVLLPLAACEPTRPPEGGEPSAPPDAGAEDDRLDDECTSAVDCPQDVPCTLGVCESAGALCSNDTGCGAHFPCTNTFCGDRYGPSCVPGELQCCWDGDCTGIRTCERWRCELPLCFEDSDCDLFFGVYPITGCFSVDDCPEGADCAAFSPPVCIARADASCEANGDEVRLLITPDGAFLPVCVRPGVCDADTDRCADQLATP